MAIWQDANEMLHDDMIGAALTLACWPQGMTQLTDAQAQALQNPAPTATELWAAYKFDVQTALDATDKTVHRVTEAVVLGKTTLTTTDVVVFMQYRASLRAILSESQPATIPTALPAKPTYPANT